MFKVYIKTGCPFCEAAEELLSELEISYELIDIYDYEEGKEELFAISGFRTFPQIFKNDLKKEDLIWGYSDLKEARDSGSLDSFIEA